MQRDPPINPCEPSPCGPNSRCLVSESRYAVCSCLPGYRGSPPVCQPECTASYECPQNRACVNLKCIDPCPGTCGIGARCEVISHNPICSCPNGKGNPFVSCVFEEERTPEPSLPENPCSPSPCGMFSVSFSVEFSIFNFVRSFALQDHFPYVKSNKDDQCARALKIILEVHRTVDQSVFSAMIVLKIEHAYGKNVKILASIHVDRMPNVMSSPIPLIAAAKQVIKVTLLSAVIRFRKRLLRSEIHAHHHLAVFSSLVLPNFSFIQRVICRRKC